MGRLDMSRVPGTHTVSRCRRPPRLYRLEVILYEGQLNLSASVSWIGRTWRGSDPTWLGYSTGRWEGETLVARNDGVDGKAGSKHKRDAASEALM